MQDYFNFTESGWVEASRITCPRNTAPSVTRTQPHRDRPSGTQQSGTQPSPRTQPSGIQPSRTQPSGSQPSPGTQPLPGTQPHIATPLGGQVTIEGQPSPAAEADGTQQDVTQPVTESDEEDELDLEQVMAMREAELEAEAKANGLRFIPFPRMKRILPKKVPPLTDLQLAGAVGPSQANDYKETVSPALNIKAAHFLGNLAWFEVHNAPGFNHVSELVSCAHAHVNSLTQFSSSCFAVVHNSVQHARR